MSDILIAIVPVYVGFALIAFTRAPVWIVMPISMSGILYAGYKTFIETGVIR